MAMMFSERTLKRRCEFAAAAWDGQVDVALVHAGTPIGKPGGLDQTYPFIPHPQYYWLAGSRRWGGVMAFDRDEGWTHFVRLVSADERLWEGEPDAPVGRDVAELPAWLAARRVRRVAHLGSIPNDVTWDESAAELLDDARRPKDDEEIALIERVTAATAAGYAAAVEAIRPGVSERAIMIELEAAMRRAGADGFGYDTIVGVGSNAAVLHFEPTERVARDGEVVLIDAGGAIAGYTADVTRAYPAGGRFTPEQKAIFDIVEAAQAASIARCQIGVEWHDVHRASAAAIASGLKDLGILRGEMDGLLESGAVALFFPHGVGHMLGLGVRDVGGHAPGRSEGRVCCGARVRVDMPLRERFLMTVEPGVYFVPAILDDPGRRAQFADMVDWDALERWRAVGGVRIEDDVLITAGAPRILTAAIPH